MQGRIDVQGEFVSEKSINVQGEINVHIFKILIKVHNFGYK